MAAGINGRVYIIIVLEIKVRKKEMNKKKFFLFLFVFSLSFYSSYLFLSNDLPEGVHEFVMLDDVCPVHAFVDDPLGCDLLVLLEE